MELQTKQIEFEKQGEFGASYEVQISKENQTLIMDILTDKMYKDPIAAICREYLCNAKDAHVENGIPSTPIEIKLPTYAYPQLEIKDYGPGISPERMKDIFVNIGSSSKRKDADQVGMYGIGSKSAFSYVDSFIVETVTNGTKRVYAVYIGEERVRKIDKISSTETEEPNGTTIQISVKDSDISKFQLEVLKATWFWDTKPMLMRFKQEYILQKRVDLFEEENQLYFIEKIYPYNEHKNLNKELINWLSQPMAIVGSMAFPLDRNSIQGLESRFYSLLKDNQMAIRLIYPIGGLSLPAHRESLHYDEETCKKICQTLETIANQIEQKAKQKIDECKDLQEALSLYFNNYNWIGSEYKDLINKSNLLYKGCSLKEFHVLFFDCHVNARNKNKTPVKPKTVYTRGKEIVTPNRTNIIDWRIFNNRYNKISVLFNDFGGERIPNNIWDQVVADPNIKEHIFIITPSSKKTYQECITDCKVLAAINPPRLRQMYSKIKVKRNEAVEKKEQEEIEVYQLDFKINQWKNQGIYKYCRLVSINPAVQSGVYLFTNFFTQSNTGSELRSDQLQALKTFLTLDSDNIYIIKEKYKDKFENTNWEHINSFINRRVNEYINSTLESWEIKSDNLEDSVLYIYLAYQVKELIDMPKRQNLDPLMQKLLLDTNGFYHKERIWDPILEGNKEIPELKDLIESFYKLEDEIEDKKDKINNLYFCLDILDKHLFVEPKNEKQLSLPLMEEYKRLISLSETLSIKYPLFYKFIRRMNIGEILDREIAIETLNLEHNLIKQKEGNK